MRKRVLTVLLVFCMACSMMACGTKEAVADAENAEENVEENTEKNVEDDEADAEKQKDSEKDFDEKSEEKESDDSKAEKKENSEKADEENLLEGLEVEEEYADLQSSEGFMFESNGDGSCTLTDVGDFEGEDLIIPKESPAGDKLTKIEENVFYNLEDVDRIIFAGLALDVDKEAFQSCEAKSVIITGSNLHIDERAFGYCEDIEEVLISNSVVEMESYAFYDSFDDAAVVIQNSQIEMDDEAFSSSHLVSLSISDSETIMGERAFSYCDDLAELTIGANNTEIGSYCFYDCGDLANISIAADSEDDEIVIELKDEAFTSCGAENVVIGRSKLEVGDRAFTYSDDLKSVEFKGSSLDIGEYVFYDCPADLVISYDGKTYNKESIEELH